MLGKVLQQKIKQKQKTVLDDAKYGSKYSVHICSIQK